MIKRVPRACVGGLGVGAAAAALVALLMSMERPALAHAVGGVTAMDFPNESGLLRTIHTKGSFDLANPFFQSLGTNGRACVNCHEPENAWSTTPAHIQQHFDVDGGVSDPLFQPVDGANCPDMDVSTEEARRIAYSLLLTKGLIRFSRPVPAGAEFEVVAIDDPYACSTPGVLSIYRRPLPATNLRFLSEIMWDGREPSLQTQALTAHATHAAGTEPLGDAVLAQIMKMQTRTFTAQQKDAAAGGLKADGANGGPAELSHEEFYVGINDPVPGLNPTGAPFDPQAFTLFTGWRQIDPLTRNHRDLARLSIARGEELFNTFPIRIFGVPGLNDPSEPGGIAPFVNGTCTTCHNTPNVGNRSFPAPQNIGVTEEFRRPADVPLFTLANKQTGEIVRTTDPGRALVTGLWKDIGRFKVPALRGLAARAPFFHDGSAPTLMSVIDFYETRFRLGLLPQQRLDLEAFLRSL
jgi:cytochrome c peroxidase